MGCGLSARGPMSPLYTNDFTPPCHDLAPLSIQFPENFPPSGIVTNENGTFFDDREFIKQCQIVHIHEITVYFEKYLTGIEIHYYLDGGIREVKHCSNLPSKRYVFPMQNSDSIVACEASHVDGKIMSLKMETIEGRILDVVGTGGHGKQKTQVNLKPQRRAVVAFKGKLNAYVEGLRVYSWKLCSKR